MQKNTSHKKTIISQLILCIQVEVIEYLVGRKADMESKDKHGISVILAAIWEGHTKCVKFLVEKAS
jgi:ankyrin repeat protein